MSHSVTAWHILRYQSASYQYDANGNRSRALYQWPQQNAAGHNQLERQLILPSGSNRIQSLTQSQNIEGQSSTTLRNFQWDADGLIGAKTRDAIRAEQQRLGMPVNGRAGQKLLKALRTPAQ